MSATFSRQRHRHGASGATDAMNCGQMEMETEPVDRRRGEMNLFQRTCKCILDTPFKGLVSTDGIGVWASGRVRQAHAADATPGGGK